MNEVFSSLEAPVPRLRHDLDIQMIKDDGEDLLLLRDPSGYSEEMLAFKPQAWALLSLFDGIRSIGILQQEIFEATHSHVDADQLLGIVAALDEYLFLDNTRYREIREQQDVAYAAETVRTAAHAGASYPDDPEELRAFFTDLFAADATPAAEETPIGILTPHIDLKIGPQVYVPAFKQLETSDIDTVVILGTSHYSDEDLFILTSKDFETPFGTMPTDGEFVRTLRERCGGIFTERDIAHRAEHSIEFPVLFLQHMFGNEKLRIVPILVTNFEEFLVEGRPVDSDERYATFIKAFQDTVNELHRKVVFVLSVDWSHVGRKFGDAVDASDVLDTVRISDLEQLRTLERCDYGQFYELLRAGTNATHIDGFSCITTFFDLVSPKRGELLDYRQWHEVERASAVSFASMAFHSV